MNVLELFAGSRSIGKQADELSMSVWSTDIEPFDKIDEVVDVLNFNPTTTLMPFVPDILWASPPCTSYSVAACYHHRNLDLSPKTEMAKLGDDLVIKTLELISYYKSLNPNLLWFIENPRGLLRKMTFMQDLPIRNTVTYCQYGDTRMKPTDIWTNNPNWKPKPACKNGDTCHTSAPRGSRTGTQGLKGSYNRSMVPDSLCYEVLKSCIK
jgi:hypothetical protein